MTNIKKYINVFIVPFIVLILFFVCTSCKENKSSKESIKQLTLGTCADFPPFEFLKDGNIIGIDIEIAKKIAKKQNAKFNIKDISFNSLILELKNGTIDFVASGFTKTDERAKNIDFSESYFTAYQKMLVKNNSNIKCKEDIKNKNIGVQLGTTGDTFVTEKNLGNIIRYDKYTDAASALLTDVIDVLVLDSFTAEKISEKNKEFTVISENLTEESYSIGVRKGDTELLKNINDSIHEMKQNGELDKIVKSYMDSSIDLDSSVKDQETKKIGSLKQEHLDYIFSGLKVTLEITLFSIIIGVFLGVLSASLKIISESKKKLKILGVLVNLYTTVVRGTPLIVQLFIIYYIALIKISKSPIMAAIITLGINSGAYVCEHIRSGISAINYGQFEAGRSLGLYEKTLMTRIILPQALKNILPSLFGEGISLLKETAAVGFIGVMDLSLAGKKITSITYEPVLPLFTVAFIYLTLVVLLTLILKKIERKIKNARN